jgi:signal transduction histidine kinase
MANGGELTVTTRRSDGNSVDVEVRDTGCGIAPENLAKIFNTFYTTKAEKGGTGLGLSVCRGIIEDHGGTMRVESEVGKGTAVIVCLPCHVPRPS